MASLHRTDLAYIHDAGFHSHAKHGSKLLLEQLSRAGAKDGLIVDLGCGSGVLARQLTAHGFDVLGIDISRDMVHLARRRAPKATLKVGSILDAQIPACVAVTAIGECFNYFFDRRTKHSRLRTVFSRIFRSLAPGGILLFDVATLNRVPGRGSIKSFIESPDWTVVVTSRKQPGRQILERRITTFRKVGRYYRRSSETHRLLLFDPNRMATDLRQIGFKVRAVRQYAGMPLLPGVVGFLARKPGA